MTEANGIPATPPATPPETTTPKTPTTTTNSCPASVATAYIVLRHAVIGLLGLDSTQYEVSLMQPTYLKESRPSAKFSIVVGKKYGSGQVLLSEDPLEQDEFWNQLEISIHRMIQSDSQIGLEMESSISNAIQRYGTYIGHVGIQKQKVTSSSSNESSSPSQIPMAHLVVEPHHVCIPPGIPYARTSSIVSITFERTQCYIQCGKKAKKAEVGIKFVVVEYDDSSKLELASSPSIPVSIPTEPLREATLSLEGLVLLERQKQKESLVMKIPSETAIVAPATTDAPTTTATTTTTSDPNNNNQDDDMIVNAFEVSGKIDYSKLVDDFGSKLLDDALLARLEALTVGKGRVPHLHRFLRRNIFFSHRDLSALLDCVEQGRPIYLYTGRGPSSSAMHLGHLVPFLFTQWLQQAFDCPLVIQMTDDEKFLFKGHYDDENGDNLNYFADLTIENARDIIACGFNKEKTFLFSDLDYVGRMYPNIVRIWKAVTTNTVNGIFGFDGTSNIGKIAFPAIQAAPAFSSSFPVVLQGAPPDTACLIPCAIDQDPYFRMTRDVAHKLVPKQCRNPPSSKKASSLGGKPALIHSKFFPPLQGARGKMSSSDNNSAVFLTDSPKDIQHKIQHHAFSGGQETKQLQIELGADLEADVSYQWLRFFLEDDEELEIIGQSYSTGKGEYWSTGAVKKRLVQVLQDLVMDHQQRRSQITDEQVRSWMVERNIL
jgi:tryptophanyl-tRNA synthetase